MRSPNDAPNNRSKVRRTLPRPKGGKALQRLIAFLGPREPRMIPEAVPADIPAAAQPKVGPARGAIKSKARSTRRATPGKAAASQAFAKALTRAAARIKRPTARTARAAAAPKRKATKRSRATAVPPGVTAAAWAPLGPSHIPNGQTYGSSRVDVIGRVSSFAVDPDDPAHLLCGSANGGIWESADTGATWAPRTDQMPTLAIGAVTFDPHDSNRVYAGSGEGNFYASLGAGVYISTNGGTTWQVLTANPFVGVGFYDLVVDPIDRNVLYAATTIGFFVSTNGGANWSRRRDIRCWDISVHPSGGTVEILAAFEDGLFVSTNGGGAFTKVTLPSSPGVFTRLSVDRTAAQPDVAYAFGAANEVAHLWRRSGTTWSRPPLPTINAGQAWYDWYVMASPTNPKQVFLGEIDAWRGTLTGNTWQWRNISTQGPNSIHPDQHALAFAPNNSNVIYACNDGGVYRSANSGAAWKALNKGLGITEVEYLAGDPSTSQWLMAGTQDNGTIRYNGAPQWTHIADGDGGDCGVNQLNPNECYHSFYSVTLERSVNKGNTWTWLAPPQVPSLFYPPVEVSGTTVAIGGTSLVITRSGQPPWSTVSLGLPSGDAPSAMRAVDANTLLVGTTRGGMLRVAWNGTTWKITPLTSPAARYISCIAVDPTNPTRIWVTISRLAAGGGGARVFRSNNGGTSWTDCTAGLPPIPINAIVVDPANYQRVWVAADVGVYESTNLGATWTAMSTGLPNALAVDLLFHKQDRVLICATRNRGVWAIHRP